MDGLHRLRSDNRTRAFFVVLSVVAFFSLAAIFAQPARADLLDAVGVVVDQAGDVLEDTVTPVTDNDVAGGEESASTSLEETVAEVIPPVAEEAVEAVEDALPVVDDVLEVVGDVPPVVEDVIEVVEVVEVIEVVEVVEVVEVIPPVVEDLLVVVDVAPIVEVVEDLSPVGEIVEEVLPAVTDIVVLTPPQVVDVIRVLPLFVPDAAASPGVGEAPIEPKPASNPSEAPLSVELVRDQPRQLNGLFTKELVAEMALFHLTDTTSSSPAAESPASAVPDPETPGLGAYMPTAGWVAVAGSAGSSSSSNSSQFGSSFSGGLDAFSFFAAMAALLALCLVGWIRDRSRSGQSIFPTHGGRPG